MQQIQLNWMRLEGTVLSEKIPSQKNFIFGRIHFCLFMYQGYYLDRKRRFYKNRGQLARGFVSRPKAITIKYGGACVLFFTSNNLKN